MIASLPAPQRYIVGSFLFLAAVAFAVAPLPLALRSAGILLFSYLSLAAAGSSAAFTTGLLAPALGLLGGDYDWLVMLPIIISSNMLALIGFEFTWRYAAIIASPLLQALPQVLVHVASSTELFAVELPWEPNPVGWISLHALVSLAAVLVLVFLDRRRERRAAAT